MVHVVEQVDGLARRGILEADAARGAALLVDLPLDPAGAQRRVIECEERFELFARERDDLEVHGRFLLSPLDAIRRADGGRDRPWHRGQASRETRENEGKPIAETELRLSRICARGSIRDDTDTIGCRRQPRAALS